MWMICCFITQWFLYQITTLLCRLISVSERNKVGCCQTNFLQTSMWASTWHLTITAIVFKSLHIIIQRHVKGKVYTVRYLGVMFDNNMKLKEHIEYFLKSKYISYILQKLLGQVFSKLYYALFRGIIWNHCESTLIVQICWKPSKK